MYAQLDDLVARVGSDVLSDLARGEPDPETMNEPFRTVEQAIGAATNLIDSYVQTKYPVPLAPVPDVIRDKAVDIALYQLASWRGLDFDGSGKPLANNYKSAERWLQDLAKGLVSLGAAPAPPQPGGVHITSNEKLFSRDRLKGW